MTVRVTADSNLIRGFSIGVHSDTGAWETLYGEFTSTPTDSVTYQYYSELTVSTSTMLLLPFTVRIEPLLTFWVCKISICPPRSSLIHYACIGVAPLDWSCRGVISRGGATPMQAKWIKPDLMSPHMCIGGIKRLLCRVLYKIYSNEYFALLHQNQFKVRISIKFF